MAEVGIRMMPEDDLTGETTKQNKVIGITLQDPRIRTDKGMSTQMIEDLKEADKVQISLPQHPLLNATIAAFLDTSGESAEGDLGLNLIGYPQN